MLLSLRQIIIKSLFQPFVDSFQSGVVLPRQVSTDGSGKTKGDMIIIMFIVCFFLLHLGPILEIHFKRFLNPTFLKWFFFLFWKFKKSINVTIHLPRSFYHLINCEWHYSILITVLPFLKFNQIPWTPSQGKPVKLNVKPKPLCKHSTRFQIQYFTVFIFNL